MKVKEIKNSMKIKATIRIDDDRFAKHPYDVMFDDEECNKKCSIYNLDSRKQCMEAIERAKNLGYDIDNLIEEVHY